MLSIEQLQDLAQASRLAAQGGDAAHLLPQLRQVLQTLAALLQSLESDPANTEGRRQQLLLCLRVLRNAAAGGTAEALAADGLVSLLASLLDLIGGAALALDWQAPEAAAQLLANAAQASAAVAAAAWGALFPQPLTALAHVHGGTTQQALALALLACCRRAEGAAADLAGPAGEPILTALLCGQHRAPEGRHSDTLGLLVAHLCLARGLLDRVWLSLAASSSDGSDGSGSGGVGAPQGAVDAAAVAPTLAHVVLLQELRAEAEADHGTLPGLEDGAAPSPAPAMAFLVSLTERLAQQSSSAQLSEGQQQVLQDALQLLRDIGSREDDGAGLAGGASLVQPLLESGAVPLLLAALAALVPIQPGGDSSGSGSSGVGPPPAAHVQELVPALAERAERLPLRPPYHGYRTDLLAGLANLGFRRPAVAAEVTVLGGPVLVLAQCQPDRASPLSREWALWAVRNLCEGSEEARAALTELRACAAADSEELARAGLVLELDEATGKPRVVQRQQL